jgi:DNA ligase-1
VPKKLLTEAPVILMAYDLLEWNGEDWRTKPLSERRAQLESITDLPADIPMRISPRVTANDWTDLTKPPAPKAAIWAQRV